MVKLDCYTELIRYCLPYSSSVFAMVMGNMVLYK